MPITPSGSSGPPFSRDSTRRGIRGARPQIQSNDEHRVNERIRVPEVRLIDENGGQLGVVSTSEALRMARDRGLDLMEVAPNVRPPVCKICDYGKFKYEKKKKEQVAKKKQTVIKVKEVQLRPGTDVHDREYKFKNVRSFLEDGDKAKISIKFRGREISYQDQAYKIMQDLIESMKDVGIVESFPKMDGRKMIMVLAPTGTKKAEKSTNFR